VVKELQNRLANTVTGKEQQLRYLHVMTRVEMRHDPKVLDRLARSLTGSCISTLTYAEIGQMLESLTLLGYSPSPDVTTALIKELENRQRALATSEDQEKLQIQDALKVFRGIFHLGMQHELNQSQLLLKAFTNLIYKNREKMTTNQTTESLFMVRQTLLYPASQIINKRLVGLQGNIREQIEAKIFKVSHSSFKFRLD
jgi:hypothetical protein